MNGKVYTLIAEDLSHLGGPMGTEYTTDSTVGMFSGNNAVEKAKKAARKHYGRKGNMGWTTKTSRKNDVLRSDDLGWVMYHIVETRVR